MIEKIIELFFPRRCAFCGDKINARYTCGKCLNVIEYYQERIQTKEAAHYDKIICAIRYKGDLRNQMLKYKFNSNRYLAKGFAEILYKKIIKFKLEPDIIIPVPISDKRMFERGFNQSDLIAKYLSQLSNYNYDSDAIRKQKNNFTQSKLAESERVKNVKDVYYITSKESIFGKKVMLIDDICTTGATVDECSRVLKEAGAKEIIVLTVMYSNLRRSDT